MSRYAHRGADIGWLPAMEEKGIVFRSESGRPVELFSFLKSFGIDSIRQRVWVNPDDDWHRGRCGIANCVAMGRRTIGAGMDYMVDFHYSDSWADPGQQRTPAAWANDTLEQLASHVYEHTRECLTALRDAGVQPKWVQTGNETDNGMMLPTGDPVSSPEKLARLFRAGYDAVHDVFPEGTLSLVHLASGYDKDVALPYLENVVRYGGRFDMVGSSYYPYWKARAEGDVEPRPAVHDRMKAMAEESFRLITERFGVPTMIVEIGGVDEEEDESYRVVRDMVEFCDDESNSCRGVFYWEPEGFRDFSHYVLSAWRNDGVPCKAMRAFEKR